MQYSERRLRIEYTITRIITLSLAVVAAVSARGWFAELSDDYASAISAAVFLLPGLYAFFTMRVVYEWARLGYSRNDDLA